MSNTQDAYRTSDYRGAGATREELLQIRSYLVEKRNEGVTPDVITDELIQGGWDADSAGATALTSLRRSDKHQLLYWTLTWSAGLAALGTASALHLAMVEPARRSATALAMWITLAVVAAPLAVVSAHQAARVEERDRFAIWSPSRRMLFGVLAGTTGVIGIGRLLTYLFEVIAALVGVQGYEVGPASLPQVIVSLGVSVPLFTWALFEWRRSNVLYRRLQGGTQHGPR